MYNLFLLSRHAYICFLFPPFIQGKVHGSLARAGKVRGQTAKVEKKDKRKQLRGRAYKRLLYNRRFVSIVGGAFTFGRRRMNPAPEQRP
jgi:small subunit ribosomal protein S30e